MVPVVDLTADSAEKKKCGHCNTGERVGGVLGRVLLIEGWSRARVWVLKILPTLHSPIEIFNALTSAGQPPSFPEQKCNYFCLPPLSLLATSERCSCAKNTPRPPAGTWCQDNISTIGGW